MVLDKLDHVIVRAGDLLFFFLCMLLLVRVAVDGGWSEEAVMYLGVSSARSVCDFILILGVVICFPWNLLFLWWNNVELDGR